MGFLKSLGNITGYGGKAVNSKIDTAESKALGIKYKLKPKEVTTPAKDPESDFVKNYKMEDQQWYKDGIAKAKKTAGMSPSK